jgi:hypothetical protein
MLNTVLKPQRNIDFHEKELRRNPYPCGDVKAQSENLM